MLAKVVDGWTRVGRPPIWAVVYVSCVRGVDRPGEYCMSYSQLIAAPFPTFCTAQELLPHPLNDGHHPTSQVHRKSGVGAGIILVIHGKWLK